MRSALLFAGSAFCIYGCANRNPNEGDNFEGLLTQRSENLKIINSENGKLSYRFQAALMETYQYDREPFREFRKGIFVETFSDSTNTVETTLVGDYAIHYMERQLWEVKGNVVATNAQGQKLETQQLFWNERTGRIYSNVDSKLTQGTDVIIGVGFESDEQFVDWEFRRPKGTVDVDTSQTDGTETDTEDDFTVTVRDEQGNVVEDVPPTPDIGGEESSGAPAEDVPVAEERPEVVVGTTPEGRRMRERPGVPLRRNAAAPLEEIPAASGNMESLADETLQPMEEAEELTIPDAESEEEQEG